MNSKEFTDWYIHNRPIYKRLAEKVESVLIEVFDAQSISYHMVTSRAKDIDSARIKSTRDKYSDPINQVHDYAGVRVITYVEDEVKAVTEIIEQLFEIDWDNSINKSEDLGTDKVGYKSVHYIAKLKADRLKLPEYKQYQNKYFEIQIRTILQHAWAEIEHDRNYKFSGKLEGDLTRRFKLLSGVLELADREFNSISNEIDSISDSVNKGELDTKLSSVALTSFLKTKFNKLLSHEDVTYVHDTRGEIIGELERFGIKTIGQLDALVQKDFDKYIEATLEEDDGSAYELGIFRMIMIINDTDRYFSEAMSNESSWSSWCGPEELGSRELTKNYLITKGVDFDYIEKKYGIPYYHESYYDMEFDEEDVFEFDAAHEKTDSEHHINSKIVRDN
ncbi:hypothetical protein CKF94_25105 [Vibrio coralliilyticus]|uniref:GTP pyrophosphokinase n=1 Tax=Vibrio coralliilyticus TaxID=190893 RepID=UPI000BAAB692|nr:hypothetical protein [Vibrio coralliilyticus]PAU35469.1 hypothetical protein CKF94_25105 [Vibrio coralliilyticus]